jgi:hypothetical protein
MIEWNQQAESLLQTHELEAIEQAMPQPGHNLADDERDYPRTRVGPGEVFRREDGTLILRTHDGHDRLLGTCEREDEHIPLEVVPPERDLGEVTYDTLAHEHADDERAIEELHDALSAKNGELNTVYSALADKDRELADSKIAATTAEARVRELEAKLAAIAAAPAEAKPE